MMWDTNPLYAVLHESIYCQGAAARWAAGRVLSSEQFAEAFDPIGAAMEGRPVNFTGQAGRGGERHDLGDQRPKKEGNRT